MSFGDNPPSDNIYFADLPMGFDDIAVQRIFGAYGQITQTKVLPTTAPGAKVAALVRFASQAEATWIVENLNGNIPQGLTDPIVARYAAKKPDGKGFSKGGAAPPSFRASPYGDATAFNAAAFAGVPGFNPAMLGMMGMQGAFPQAAAAPAKGGGKGGKVSVQVLYNGLLAAGALPGNASYSVDSDHTLYVGGLPADTQDIDLYKIFSPFGAIAPRGVRAMLWPEGNCKGFGFVNFSDPAAAQVASDVLNGTQMPDGTVIQVKPKSPSMKVEMGGM